MQQVTCKYVQSASMTNKANQTRRSTPWRAFSRVPQSPHDQNQLAADRQPISALRSCLERGNAEGPLARIVQVFAADLSQTDQSGS